MMDYLDVKRDDINYMHLYGDATKLMENAARQLSDFVRKTFVPGSRICAVCGTGNNAGDGIAALENLRGDYDVSAVLVKGKGSLKTDEAKWAIKRYKGRVSGIRSLKQELAGSDIILDCMFGVGISGEPREPYAKAIEQINKSGKKIVSIDVPSGLGTKRSVMPDYTVTFTDVKKGMAPENSGDITVCDIGIPESVRKYAGPGDMVYYTRPDPSSHKGMNGSLSIIGGWEYYGSSVIAALGANAMAIDLVKIYTTPLNYEIIATYSPFIIVRNIAKLGNNWKEDALRGTALLIGPGLGISDEAQKDVKQMLGKAKMPIIVDADGIKLMSDKISWTRGRNMIFTPHRREFEILTGLDANEENAVKFAEKHSVVIVLKGVRDIVTDGSRTIYVEGGNVRMTMGGTGDLLAGLISAMASRNIDPFRSAVMGAYINKKIAERAFSSKSYWYSIDDMIDAVPGFMKESANWA
ncbi:sugar kinase [uncultured archaeon]|nr:sugar kinase [uncultured archaeon]